MRETQNDVLSQLFDLLLSPKSNLSRRKQFSVPGLVSLTFTWNTLFFQYGFALHQQSSTFRRQKQTSVYTEFKPQSDEINPNFQK